jgi:hypothetical protein
MKAFVIAVLGMTSGAVAAQPADVDRTGRPVRPPIETHPFGAVETRPLWDRPAGGPGVQQRTEHTLDRGTGRVADEPTYELDRMAVERAEQRFRAPPGATYDLEQDRREQLERERLKQSRAADQERRFEREEEALADLRARWESVLRRENAAGGAVVDQQALARVEQDYRAALAAAAKQRDAAIAAANADKSLTPQQRQARRDAAMSTYEQASQSAARQRENRRATIFGWPPGK